MANFVYNDAKRLLANGDLDWDTDTIKLRLVKTGSSAGSDRNANFLSDITTMNTHDGTTDQTVTGRAIVENAGQNRVELTAGNTTFSAVPAASGGAACIGCIYYKDGASDAARIPIIWVDSGFPFTGSGSDVTVRPNASGVWYY